ncbi:hypothetical protein [Pseudactinotalea sp.]|uniref:ApeA N-terminal domain 1-containing protein n=1 Tax=Pseudactinotalea sp. TaxID=1926260 RepID=UPI003B3A3BDD
MRMELSVGDGVTGLLIDGLTETPYVAATLKVESTGLVLEVPYIMHGETDQFRHLEQWFSGRMPPANLQLYTNGGTISLFDITWGGHSERQIAVGILRPALAVLHGRDGDLSDPLTVATLQSRVDGLNEWGKSSAIEIDHHVDSARLVTGLSISVSSVPAATWRQGDAVMTIRASWSTEETTDEAGRAMRILDNLILESTFEHGARSVAEHLREHRKVVDLLTILFGGRTRYLGHLVKDARFVDYSLGGTVIGHPTVELFSRQTIADRPIRNSPPTSLTRPLASLAELGVDALVKWSQNYDEWKRFILPSAGAFRRESPYLEDSITSMCIAMEAGGQILGQVPGEAATYGRKRPTLATYVYRCLSAIGVDWGENISSTVGLARAIATNGNTLKHPDRGAYPDYTQSYVVRMVSELTVRLLALYLAGGASDVLADYRKVSGLAWRERQVLQENAISIDDAGVFHLG